MMVAKLKALRYSRGGGNNFGSVEGNKGQTLDNSHRSLKIILERGANLKLSKLDQENLNFGTIAPVLHIDMRGEAPTDSEKFNLTATDSSTFVGDIVLRNAPVGAGKTDKTAKIDFTGGEMTGGIFHSGGSTLTATFASGAKLNGGINAYNGATNTFTFTANTDKDVVMNGKLYARTATNSLTFSKGSYFGARQKDGNINGILAYNVKAKNNLTFSSTTASQALVVGGITVNVSGENKGLSNNSNANNTINFSNTTHTGYVIVDKDFSANGGTNNLAMEKGLLLVAGSLKTAARHFDSQNTITIKEGDTTKGNLGMVVVGKDLDQKHPSAIYAYGGGIGASGRETSSGNVIRLGGDTTGSKKAHLATADIVAGEKAANDIQVYGDLAFIRVKDATNQRISSIYAENSGTNNIEIRNGSIKTADWISGGQPSQNPTMENTTDKDLVKGERQKVALIARSEGRNYLYFGNGSDYTSKIDLVEAENGRNVILTLNHSAFMISNLHTKAGGSNLVGVGIGTTGNREATIGSNYSNGATKIYFGTFNNSGITNKGSITKDFGADATTDEVWQQGAKFDLKPDADILAYKEKYQKVVAGEKTFGADDAFVSIIAGATTNDSDKGIEITGLANGTLEFKGNNVTGENLYLSKNSAFVGTISVAGSAASKINLTMGSGSKLVLKGNTSLDSLTLTSAPTAGADLLKATLGLDASVVDLVTDGVSNLSKIKERKESRTLTIKTLTFNNTSSEGATGKALFRVGVQGQGKADKIIATKVTTSPTDQTPITADIQVFMNSDMLDHDFSKDTNKTYVFEAQKDSKLTLQSQKAVTGFITYTVDVNKEETTGKWYIGRAKDQTISDDAVTYTSSAMGLNYTFYLQNLNSLNKRMGELRGNNAQNGVWARMYGGEMKNTMEYIPVDVSYFNIQGGYDYAFDFENARNYLGASINYGHAFSETADVQGQFSVLGYKGNTDTIELAVYNSYIQDEGWFSDSIAKLSYITSKFDVKNISSSSNIDNFAFSLGEEFGYRFRLGEQKEWFIDPQAEFVLGYFNATDFTQNQAGQTLLGKLDGLATFRSRIGSDFGYTLKKDKNQYDFRVGLSYEYDVASADSHFEIQKLKFSKTLKDTITSDGRVVLNLGTNMDFGNGVKAYFDFESSFAGKITTTYQLNAGVRYGFGEKVAQVNKPKAEEQLPVKIEEKQEEGESQEKQ